MPARTAGALGVSRRRAISKRGRKVNALGWSAEENRQMIIRRVDRLLKLNKRQAITRYGGSELEKVGAQKKGFQGKNTSDAVSCSV